MVRTANVKLSASDRYRKASGNATSPGLPTEASMQVFTLGEVAEILQAPKSRVKNWTIGRPLRIIPRVLAGLGKGSRNLYSLNDLYIFAIANQMYSDGLSMNAIEHVVDAIFLTPHLGSVHAISLQYAERKLGVHTSDTDWRSIRKSSKRAKPVLIRIGGISAKAGKRAKPVLDSGTYSLDVAQLIAWVKYRVEQLRGRS